MAMPRIIVRSPQDAPLFDLAPDSVVSLYRTEELNGENSLDIATTTRLAKGLRVLVRDEMGTWREYVVAGADERHDSGESMIGTYHAVQSMQYDLSAVIVKDARPGVVTPTTASVALTAALSTTSRWQPGTCTVTSTGGVMMYYVTAWQALSDVVETFGGEIVADIDVAMDGTVTRTVDLLAQAGATTPTRRFDWGADMRSIQRKVEDEPIYCRVIPRGKGEETESGAYGRRIGIESVNDGKDYLQNDDVAQLVRLPDGNGGWEYPTAVVIEDDIDQPQALKDWGELQLDALCQPHVTYTADVAQFAEAGMDVHGIALGDVVVCVDRGFAPDLALRVRGRVARIVTNELYRREQTVSIGGLGMTLDGYLLGLDDSLGSIRTTVRTMNGGTMSTSDYLSRLIDRLNGEINATGGYTYITEGQGLRTYDRAVSDPLVGAEATKVVEIKGGSIRIADSKTAGGEWEWKTVFVSGHIAAELVTAANITAGYIGSAASGNYWNLDTGELQMAATTTVGGQTVQQIANTAANSAKSQAISAAAQDAQTRVDNLDAALDQAEVFDRLTNGGGTQGIYLSNGLVYINGQYIQANSINSTSIRTQDLSAERLGTDSTHYGTIGNVEPEEDLNYNGFVYHDTDYDTGFFIGTLSNIYQNEIWMGIVDNNNDNDVRLQLNSNFVRLTNDSRNYPQFEIYGWRGSSGAVGLRFKLENSSNENKWIDIDWNNGITLTSQRGQTVYTDTLATWPTS